MPLFEINDAFMQECHIPVIISRYFFIRTKKQSPQIAVVVYKYVFMLY